GALEGADAAARSPRAGAVAAIVAEGAPPDLLHRPQAITAKTTDMNPITAPKLPGRLRPVDCMAPRLPSSGRARDRSGCDRKFASQSAVSASRTISPSGRRVLPRT